MSEFEAHLGLLPTGFVDLMPEEAEKEASAINALMALFTGYGYQRIKPPLMEFEESLLAPGPGAALAKDTFRVMDPVSRRMMGVRADITPQIARIVCTRLPKDQEPMRLTYANDALRASAGQLRSARQFTQVGCEMTGVDGAACYAESITLAILGVKALGITDVTVDLALPRLLDTIIAEADMGQEQVALLRQALDKRDRDRVAALEFSMRDMVLTLLDASGYADEALRVLGGLTLPEAVRDDAAKLALVVRDLQQALSDLDIDDVRLTFDAFETKGFEYHRGIAFTLFSKSIRGELGRGGHYVIGFGTGKTASHTQKAIGFTLYMDTIRPAVRMMGVRKVLAVPRDAGWKMAESWRQQGWSVILYDAAGSANGAAVPDNATHILVNNKPQERK